MAEDKYVAIVDRVFPEGEHGPYAKASAEGINGKVTFALGPDVWSEERWPEEGTYVVLTEVIRKRAGWRAQHARFFKPGDQEDV